MRKNIAAAASPVLLLLSSAALCADWVSLGADARGNAWHINMDSIAKDRETVTAWKRVEFRHPYPHFVNGAPVIRAFILGATDCTQRRASVKAMGFLDPEGSIVAIHEQGESNSVHWPPGALGALLEAAMAKMCSGTGHEAN